MRLCCAPGCTVCAIRRAGRVCSSTSGLRPGKYKLNIPGQPLQTIIIGKDGRLNGRVQKPVDKGSNGPAKAMYNGDVSITTDAEATRKNQPASKGVGEPAKAKSGDGNPILQGIGTTK